MYKPFVIKDGPIAYFDVDDTLIMWERPKQESKDEQVVTITTRDRQYEFVVNKFNVEYLKKLSMRAHNIVVWSAGGSEWAQAVVKALNLEEYVNLIAPKPTYYVDDVFNPSNFMGKHVYYTPEGERVGFSPNLDTKK